MSAGERTPVTGVLHVVASTNRRGAEVFALDLAAALAERGHPGQTLSLTDGGSLVVDAVGRGRFHPSTLRSLRKAAATASVVVAHGSSTLLAAAMATAGTSTPFVYRNIGDPDHWISRSNRRTRVGFLLRRAERVVALWPEAADRLAEVHGLDPERVDVAGNGVDSAAYETVTPARRSKARALLGVPEGDPTICFVGSLTIEKDPMTAVRAVSEFADATLLVAGDGALREPLERAADELMPGRVRFLSYIDDVRPVLAASDALILTSRTEGLPAVLIEAGLTGIPVVASAVGGVPEIVDDWVTGFLVSPGDALQFAAGIEQALRAGRPMGVAARARCLGRFTLESVADRWASVIDSTIRTRAER